MTVELVTKEGLKEALLKFRERADERWVNREQVISMITEKLGSLAALTEEDQAEIVALIED